MWLDNKNVHFEAWLEGLQSFMSCVFDNTSQQDLFFTEITMMLLGMNKTF